MELRVLSSDDLSGWFEYYERLPSGGPYHHPDYVAHLEGYFEFDAESVRLAILEDGDDFVYYPFFLRQLSETTEVFDRGEFIDTYDIVSSWYYGGPLLSDEDNGSLADRFVDEFGEYCRSNGIIAEFVRFDPNICNHAQFEGLEPDLDRKTVPVDLTKSLDEIWNGYTSSNRNHIRNARDAEFEVRKATSREEVAAFNEIYSQAMEAKDASDHYRFSLSFFTDLIRERSTIATLLVSRYEGEIVGGSILVHNDNTANEFLRASSPEYWDLGLNNHLCHNAVEHMYERGFRRLDFQGGRPGVFDFKKAFSPDRGEFYTARRIHNEELYAEAVATAESAGIDTESGYFPAYRIEMS